MELSYNSFKPSPDRGGNAYLYQCGFEPVSYTHLDVYKRQVFSAGT